MTRSESEQAAYRHIAHVNVTQGKSAALECAQWYGQLTSARSESEAADVEARLVAKFGEPPTTSHPQSPGGGTRIGTDLRRASVNPKARG